LRLVIRGAAADVVMAAAVGVVSVVVADVVVAASLVFVDSPVFGARVVFTADIFFTGTAGSAVIRLQIRATMVTAVAGDRCGWSG